MLEWLFGCSHHWRCADEFRWQTIEEYESGAEKQVKLQKQVCIKCGDTAWKQDGMQAPYAFIPATRYRYEGENADLRAALEE